MRVVIIGAGFGGIAAAAALTDAGHDDLVLLERADAIGGVWRDNTYPGCACDIPAPLYSFSFAPNPAWSSRFPPHDEILAYLRRVAAERGLTPKVRLGTEVAAAVWHDEQWTVTTTGGEQFTADILVPAVGQLSNPALPVIPGSFGGPVLHTARWDGTLSLAGKRVGVVGTGASAIQLVPAIAGTAAHVTVFQRNAPWTLPKPNRRYGRVRRAAYRAFPGLTRLARAGSWLLTVITGRAVTGNRAAGAFLRAVSDAQRRLQVRDPRLRAQVTPREPMGCKRVLFTSDWLPALARPDVTLVTGKVVELADGQVRTADGASHPCDVLVYATGFAATSFLVPMHIVGRDGLVLADVWRGGAHAYLGLTVPGFPNLFLMYGPNTNTGNTSVIYFLEAQARYLAQAAGLCTRLEVRADAAARFDDEMQRRLATSVWTGCQSWYRDAAGRIVTNWPGLAAEYRRRTARLNRADYV